jgi:hypothetical protein
MNGLRVTSLVLACALFAPAVASAKSKPLDPATVHARILKRGIGSWICVQEVNGVALVGRVVSINEDSVGLQLQNYPEVTPVPYADIVDLRMDCRKKASGPSRRSVWEQPRRSQPWPSTNLTRTSRSFPRRPELSLQRWFVLAGKHSANAGAG